MGKYSRPEVEYVSEEGFVRLNLRRPVNLYVPSDLQESYDPTAKGNDPPAKLDLEWVYGYRGRDCRNNICLLESGEIVYFAAAAAVIYNPATGTQRHYTAHTDDIKCLAVHPDGKTVATGQIKGRDGNLPHVRIWDSETLETIHEIGNDTFNRAVNAIDFNKEGDLLAVVDDSPEPRLSVWKWAEETKQADTKASSNAVLGVTFTKEMPPRIVTSGKNHLAFWILGEGDLTKKTGIFGDHEKPKYVTAVDSLDSGDVISGDSNGNLLIWMQGGNTVRTSVTGAHGGSIFNVAVNDEDGTFYSAGTDRKVVVFNNEFEATGESLEIPEEFGSPRVVLKNGGDFYIGTTNNCILKTNFEEESPTLITQGHLEELWGLAGHDSEPHFVTAGQDGNVHYRNASSHATVWSKKLEMACQSADFTKNDQITVIGGNAGKWVAIDNETQEILHEGEDGDEIIQVTRFSPDGSKLALGSRDNQIYIIGFDEEEKTFSKLGGCQGHSSFITHLDWSQDGEMLRTNSGDYEVLHWKLEDFSLVSQSEDFKNVEWATNNCILAFNSIGIWPPGTDGTHINSCNKAKEKPLMATGDDFGKVKLFAYPSSVQNAKHEEYHGHSSHITNVIFLENDSLILSSGGRDTTTMQWRVVEPAED